MSRLLAFYLITSILLFPSGTWAQSSDEGLRYGDPYVRITDETEEEEGIDLSTLTPEQRARLEFTGAIGGSLETLDLVQAGFGTFNEEGEYKKGSLEALKLKPSDKKRLIKLATGNITEREAASIQYDARLLELLVKLTTPRDAGGGGFHYLRVGDYLRFRNDPRSRETEGADNISQHQFGKAADILEINKTHCTKDGGLLGSDENLPPFPVKVAWQGGGFYDPNAVANGSFDAIMRANALRDILGALPGEAYNGHIQGLEDLLQQLQRRVLADELGLTPESLDFVSDNGTLEALGRIELTDALNYPTGALQGENEDEILRSLPQSYLEDALTLPPGSLKGDDWNSALERLGRMKVAYDINVDPAEILRGNVDKIRDAAYYNYYKNVEAAFRLPSGSLEGIRNNRAEDFRKIGALLMADRLRYSPEEQLELVSKAGRNEIKQLSLARIGDIPTFPGSILPMIAPSESSSKAEGERYIARLITGSKVQSDTLSLPENITHVLDGVGIRHNSAKETTESLVKSKESRRAFREVGATMMEEAFSLPQESLAQVVRQHENPSLEQFQTRLGQRVLEEYRDVRMNRYNQSVATMDDPAKVDTELHLEQGTTQRFNERQLSSNAYKLAVGKAYYANEFTDSFRDLYHIATTGLAGLSHQDMYDIVLGKTNNAAIRAGASWVEEDLGMVPDTFTVLFTDASAEDRLVSAGVSMIAGELFESFEASGQAVQNGDDLKRVIGQAKVETSLGLNPGSFRDSLNHVREKNSVRFSAVFDEPSAVDTILGLEGGTTKRFLDGQVKPEEIITQLPSVDLAVFSTETLHNKLGWDGRFAVDGEQLSRTLTNGSTTDVDTGATVTTRDLLAKIGGYASDFALGYEPGTFDRWSHAASQEERNRIVLRQGSKLYTERLGLEVDEASQLLDAYRDDSPALKNTIVTAFKKRIEGEVGNKLQIPQSDLLSIVEGDMPSVTAVLIASSQAQRIKADLDNPYQYLRTIIGGWSSLPDFETALSTEAIDRYNRVIEEFAATKTTELLDQQFERITKGILIPGGGFNPNASPYSQPILNQVSNYYFATKEARVSLFYSAIDAQLKRTNPNLPEDFSKLIMDGSTADRSDMLFSFLQTKLSDGILGELPTDMQAPVLAWLQNPSNVDLGEQLADSDVFTEWSSAVFARYTQNVIPPEGFKLAVDFALGKIDASAIQENPDIFATLGRETFTGFINQQLNLPIGQFTAYYDKYLEAQSIVSDFKTGTMSTAEAAFAVDQLILDGALTEFTSSIGDALGLPEGSFSLLVQYAITQNPIYLAQFALDLLGIGDFLFGGEVECPDLQEEAQKNIKNLIEQIADFGTESAYLIPSQIITYHPSYGRELADKLKQNYYHCFADPSARCGLFARPEYNNQVHIGF